jgi:hypothetical protein
MNSLNLGHLIAVTLVFNVITLCFFIVGNFLYKKETFSTLIMANFSLLLLAVMSLYQILLLLSMFYYPLWWVKLLLLFFVVFPYLCGSLAKGYKDADRYLMVQHLGMVINIGLLYYCYSI